MKPIVVIVGRPNVGKSTLFNRLTKSRDALVSDYPGVTRDRHYGPAQWRDQEFMIVDTGGFASRQEDQFAEGIRLQIEKAVDEADAVILLLDGKSGITPYDRDLIEVLRPLNKPVFYVVNKIDGYEQEALLPEFYALGIAPLHPLSAEHRYGLNDLLDELTATLAEVGHDAGPDADIEQVPRLAVVGRPNVGKSSLINKLTGATRLLVSDIPGTTRDAIDTDCFFGEKRYRFIDTAGIRRKGKVSARLEKFSVIKSLRSLDRCDIALIVLDTAEGITDQDITIAGYAHARGCGCILLLNKWDLIRKDEHTVKHYTDELRRSAKYLAFAPILTLSAKTGQRVHKIFDLVDTIYGQYTARIGTGKLNRIIENAVHKTEPSLHRGRRIKIFYTTQIATAPPTIVCFTNYPEAIHFSYQRYLRNQIRVHSDLKQTPLKLVFRRRDRRAFISKGNAAKKRK